MAAEVPDVPGRPSETARPEPARGEPARGKLAQIGAQEFSLTKAIGGPLGLVESVLPYTVFSLWYAFDRELRPAIYAALVPVVALALWRIVRREPLTQAVSGVVGVAIGAYASYKTGSAANFFLPNILKNVAFAVLYLVSILGRWPLLGVVLGSLRAAGSTMEKNAEPAEEPSVRDALAEMKHQMFGWRDDPVLLAAYQRATWLWVGLFVVRIAVQTPLWLTDQVTLLGLLNGLVLGVPLFALTIYLSWLVLRDVLVAPRADAAHDADIADDAADNDPDGEKASR